MITNRSHKIISITLLLLLIGISYSCSTKKNTFTRRLYHNITGHYNMFWNGRESFREGVVQQENSVKDNFNKVLPIYNYGTEQDAQSLNPYMDKAIEKSSVNVQRHSMFFNRKEYVRWIDDSYLLIGKSYFYKQEYNKARRTFEFVINEYSYNTIRFEAMWWLANSYNQMGKYKRAQSALDNLNNEISKSPDEVPQKIQLAIPLLRADMLIAQEKYTQAKEFLLDAIYMNQKKKDGTRARFVLAQIYQMDEEFYTASEYYKQVIKRNPEYQLSFNAAINMARSYDARYGEGSKDIEKNLNRMLKEDKNKDYRDQIYYALADVAFKNGADSLAIEYLALSVASSVQNDFQKTTSALALGDLYFKVPEYQQSQAYYDTAVQAMPDDFPNKEEIEKRTTYLTELVQNLIIIETEDSLQMVAAMPEEERTALIEKIIEEVIAEEERQKELEEQMAFMNDNMSQMQGGSQLPGGPSGGGWYFYNTTALSFGFTEFKKKWGNRKLEDNWRLSNKQATFDEVEQGDLLAVSDSTASDTTASGVPVSNDPKTVDFYLQDLPFAEDQLIASNDKIMNAMFDLGLIYKDKLENYPKSIESFTTLNTRYPDFEKKLQSYYQLYRSYTVLENIDSANHYKNLIVTNYPESDYAKLLTNPDYFRQLEAEKNRAITLYSETWEQYQKQNYYTVYSNSTRALKEFEEPTELLAKFQYLRALAIGKIDLVDSLQAQLDTLIVRYPDSEVNPLAKNILDYLKGPVDSTSFISENSKEIIDYSIYEFNDNSKQIYSMVVRGPVDINPIKVRISDFNQKFYSLENLSVTSILLDKTTHFVMVSNFPEIERAMNYYNAISINDYVFSSLDPSQYDGFIIAQENYPVFYKDKDLKKYKAFFEEYYLNPQ